MLVVPSWSARDVHVTSVAPKLAASLNFEPTESNHRRFRALSAGFQANP